MRASIPRAVLIASLLAGMHPAPAQPPGIDPDALTVADFAFLPGADEDFVAAYALFLKARAGDQPQGGAVPTYGEAARALLEVANDAPGAEMKTRCRWLAALSQFLDMDLAGAARTAETVLAEAGQSWPRQTAIVQAIIAQVDVGRGVDAFTLAGLLWQPEDQESEAPAAQAAGMLFAIIERSAQTREARARVIGHDLLTRLPDLGEPAERLRTIAVLDSYFEELSVSRHENLSKLQQALCAANLRHLGVALHLYAQDHAGLFPEAWEAEQRQIWQFKVLPYTGDGSWSGRGPVWHCPACPAGGFSYGINQSIAYRSETSEVRCELARITQPHETVLLTDSVHYMPGDYPHKPNYGGAAYKVHAPREHAGTGTIDWNRHCGGANVLLVDGRVEWRQHSMPPGWRGR